MYWFLRQWWRSILRVDRNRSRIKLRDILVLSIKRPSVCRSVKIRVLKIVERHKLYKDLFD